MKFVLYVLFVVCLCLHSKVLEILVNITFCLFSLIKEKRGKSYLTQMLQTEGQISPSQPIFL